MIDPGLEELKNMAIKAPMRCAQCGIKTETMKKKKTGWVMLSVGIPGVAFFGCPKCFSLHINPDAADNINLIRKIQARRVQPVSKIINMPGRNMPNPGSKLIQ